MIRSLEFEFCLKLGLYSKWQDALTSLLANHLHAPSPDEIFSTSGFTDSINLVAISLGRSGLIGKSNVILISTLEQHSNFAP